MGPEVQLMKNERLFTEDKELGVTSLWALNDARLKPNHDAKDVEGRRVGSGGVGGGGCLSVAEVVVIVVHIGGGVCGG